MKAQELIQLLIVLVFIVVPAILQWLGRRQQQQQQQQRQQQLPRRGLPQRPARPPQEENRPLASEIEDFLRRAREKQRPAAPSLPGPAARPQKKPPSAAPFRPPQRAPVVRAEVVRPAVGEGLARPVGGHKVGDLSQRESSLGDQASQDDQQRDARLRGVFDHRLGQLQQQSVSSASASETAPQTTHTAAAPLAELIFEMIARPESVRRAIVINEILQRPEDRWK